MNRHGMKYSHESQNSVITNGFCSCASLFHFGESVASLFYLSIQSLYMRSQVIVFAGIFTCPNILYSMSRSTPKRSLRTHYFTLSTDYAHWLPFITSGFYLVDTPVGNAPRYCGDNKNFVARVFEILLCCTDSCEIEIAEA